MSTEISVDLDFDGAPMRVGTADFHFARAQISTTFIYAESYLAQRWASAIDPVRTLSSAPFSVSELPGASSHCAELFRRVVYSVAMHNTDDHLRNHGFIRRRAGWELSPVFDVNPEPDLSVERQTSVKGASSADDEVDALCEFGTLCHLEESAVRQTMIDVAKAAGRWRSVTGRLNLPDSEIAMFAAVIDRQVDAIMS